MTTTAIHNTKPNPPEPSATKVSPNPRTEPSAKMSQANPIIDGYKIELTDLKAQHARQRDELTTKQTAEVKVLEDKINPPKPVEALIHGDFTFKGYSYADGLPIEGKVTVAEPGTTKEGVFQAARSGNQKLNRDGFSYTATKAP